MGCIVRTRNIPGVRYVKPWAHHTRDAEHVPLETLARIGAALFRGGLTDPDYEPAGRGLTVSQRIGVLIWMRW